jgi:anaerobic magnesium-protoporphyrin IX monomethyl ester cyclase
MSKLDLLLVNAPSRIGVYQNLSEFTAIEPPVWAGLIARYCLNRGYSVEILDAEATFLHGEQTSLDVEQTAWQIALLEPRLAVFCIYGHQPSASTQCLPAASAVARELKSLRPDIPTLALGTHMSALPEKTLREEPFDYVCQGEGPRTIAPMLENLRQEKPADKSTPFTNDFQWPMGLCHLNGGGFGRSMYGMAPNIEDLDRELPNQAWELLYMRNYRPHHWHRWMGDPKGGYASVQTSLGCSFRCQFCCIQAPFGDSTPRMRFWSPENVVKQIEGLVVRYGITNLKIPDEMFCLNRNHVKGICNGLIGRGLGDRLNIWAYARVDTVKDTELLDLMRRAGFKDLGIGIESASKHVRDGVEKGRFGNEQILEAVARVNAAGIHVGANFIFGLPDDTLESMQETLDLACEINAPYTNLYCAMAYPGSQLHKMAKEKGWRLPEDPGGPGWIGYSQHAYETLPLPTETLTSEQVLDFRDEAWLHFHQRPEYLNMLQAKFGLRAVEDMQKILALGKPKRKHREEK